MNENCVFDGCFGRWTPSLEGRIVSFRLEISSGIDIKRFKFKVSTPSHLLTSSLTLQSFSRVLHSSPVINIFPAPACATLSLLSGSGLVHATAGQFAAFQIFPRDEFGNVAKASATNWVVRTRCRSSGAAANSCASQASVAAPTPDQSFSAKYLPLLSVPSYISISLFDDLKLAYGLFATVYADSSYHTILSNKVVSLNTSAAPYLRSLVDVPTDISFSAAFRMSPRPQISFTSRISL